MTTTEIAAGIWNGQPQQQQPKPTRDQLAQVVRIGMPDPEIRAKASSHYTAETIDSRLAVLRERDDQAARDEIEYLTRLRLRKFGA